MPKEYDVKLNGNIVENSNIKNSYKKIISIRDIPEHGASDVKLLNIYVDVTLFLRGNWL